MKKNKISRREFLKLTLTSIGAFLASCMPRINQTSAPTLTVTSSNTPEPTQTETPTPTATQTQTLTPTPSCFNLLTPENGKKLSAIGKVTFSWEAMPGAASYKLEITLPTGQAISFNTDGLSRDQYLEAIKLAGIFQWRVIALAKNSKVICTSESFTFEKQQAPSNQGGGDNGGDGSGNTTGGGPGTSGNGGTGGGDGEGPGAGGTGAGGAGSSGSWSSGSAG